VPGPSDIAEIDLERAGQRLSGRVHTTPLLHSSSLDRRAGARLWLKAESFQRSGSFKARGAFNALLAGIEAGDRRGVLAVSSGNHGQAVALAAAELGLPATVVMPEGSSPVKVAAVAAYGATVVTEGVTGLNREEVARSLAAELDLRLVHPHDDPWVIAGQSTVATELVAQAARAGFSLGPVLVPVGGGGLLSGVCLALERSQPGAVVIGVEPALGDDAKRSLEMGRLVTLDRTPATVADGARTLHLGGLCWEVIRQRVDRIVTVTEAEIAEACWWLWSRCKLVVEPTGALTVAAALRARRDPSGLGLPSEPGDPLDLVCILSGGNCTPDQIADLLTTTKGGELS
jgi:threonine dehydratase